MHYDDDHIPLNRANNDDGFLPHDLSFRMVCGWDSMIDHYQRLGMLQDLEFLRDSLADLFDDAQEAIAELEGRVA